MAGTRRTGFRGDSRPPEEIFVTGFEPREPNAPITYYGDNDANKSISFSWRMRAATYFPLPDLSNPENISETWLYVVNIDISNASKDEILSSRVNENKLYQNKSPNDFVNIHSVQVVDGMKFPGYDKHIRSIFYAEEIAAKKIKPHDILFAVRCTRLWNDPMDFKKGGQFTLTNDIKVNPHRDPSIPGVMVRMAEQLLGIEIQESKAHPINMPMPESGYAKNKLQIACIDIDAKADSVEKNQDERSEKPDSIQHSPTNRRKRN